MHALSSRVTRAVGRGDNVLFLSPSFRAGARAACTDLLAFDDPADKRVLCISFTESVADRRAAWDRYVDDGPDQAVVVDVAAELRADDSPGPSSGDRTPATSFAPTVDRVTSPADLTTIGVRISDRLDDWLPPSPDHQVVGCFESVSTLLQYADTRQTHKFLAALTDRFATADAIAHYHMDPAAHDERTMATITPLFDAVCEPDGDELILRER